MIDHREAPTSLLSRSSRCLLSSPSTFCCCSFLIPHLWASALLLFTVAVAVLHISRATHCCGLHCFTCCFKSSSINIILCIVACSCNVNHISAGRMMNYTWKLYVCSLLLIQHLSTYQIQICIQNHYRLSTAKLIT